MFVQQAPIKSCGSIPTPLAVLYCTRLQRLTKKLTRIVGDLITHDIIGCPGQFIAQSLDCNSFVRFGHLALIELLRFRRESNGEVCCLYIGPGQVLIAILPVIFSLCQ